MKLFVSCCLAAAMGTAAMLVTAPLSHAGTLEKAPAPARAPAPMRDAAKTPAKHPRPPEIPLTAAQFAYVRANLVSTLYHEFGHALIDELSLPVLGQEEDAADVASVILLERMFKGDELMQLARDTAAGFRADALRDTRDNEGWHWADVHGPNWQRYYNFVCLFYGADPKGRADFATAMKLPDSRAESCADERDLAQASWGAALKDVATTRPSDSISFESRLRRKRAARGAAVIGAEVVRLNRVYHLPTPLRVVVKHCGDDASLSAFYNDSRTKITVCTEYIDQLNQQARKPPDL